MKQLVIITADVKGDPLLRVKSNWHPISEAEFNRIINDWWLIELKVQTNAYAYLLEQVKK